MKRLLLTTLFTAVIACGKAWSAENYDTPCTLIPAPREMTLHGVKRVAPKRCDVHIIAPDNRGDEYYSIDISKRRITICAAGERGAIWAQRTLSQLRDEDGLYPQLHIEDWPEFPIRGFMWDDGRNFAGTEVLHHYIDMMSECKMNLFQWHLTDHPAWRAECRCHPQLNDPQYQRAGRDNGCFYTYDEIREIIGYARQRGVTVVPEIDMPGHSTYFNAAFGCPMDSPEGRAILEECIGEFCSEIPADLCPCIHIGSDEVHISDPEGFMSWAQNLLRSYGRTTLVWDPGLPCDNLSVRQIWRDGSPDDTAIDTDTPFVDSSMGYLNYYDPLLFTAKMFFHTPCYTGRSSENALGGILCMWNDVRAVDKQKIEHHNGMAAGMLVFAERFWNGGATTENYTGSIMPSDTTQAVKRFYAFQQRMTLFKRRFWSEEMRFWTPLYAPKWDVTLSTPSARVEFEAWGDILDLDALSRRYGIAPSESVECRIRRTIYSDCDTVRLFLAGFDSPARSNRISDGIPAQGEWPNSGCLLVNGEAVAPQLWQEPDSYRFHFNTWARPEEELPYTDEQLYWMNKPVEIHLHKGENTIELGLKRHFAGQRFHVAFIEKEM